MYCRATENTTADEILMDTVGIGDEDGDKSYIDTSFETVYWFKKCV